MNIYDISRKKSYKEVFDIVIEEACRQWCDGLDDAPERADGQGFANFFYEIFEDKCHEYIKENKEIKEEISR